METTAAGVVFLAKDTGRCLLQLRNSDKRFKHTWGFWGGILEGTETPYECIRRELEFLPPKLNGESSGYAWVDIGTWPQPLHNGAKVTLYKNGGTEKLHTILDIHTS